MSRDESFWKRLPKAVGFLVTSCCQRARSILKGTLRWSVSGNRTWLRDAHQSETSSETLLVKYSMKTQKIGLKAALALF